MKSIFRSDNRQDGPSTSAVEHASRDLGRLESVLDVLSVGVVIYDAGGRPVMRNRSATELLGDYQSDALMRAAVERVAGNARAGRFKSEVLELHGAGRRFTISAGALEGGEVAVIVEDTSERKRLDQLRRDFVANVSHELRTPIGAIVLLAETLSGESDPHALELLHEHIAAEAKRAERLVEELLNLSRVEGMRETARELLHLPDLIDQAVQRVTPMAALRHIEIQGHAPDDPVDILGDENELLSAFSNLLENAVKYSDPGAVVHVEVAVTGDNAEVHVRDTGIGIPARDLDRVFERFYRVDQARSRDTGGAGLGLSIVRHVADNHGGRISVQSREGEGSTFTLTLPVQT